MTTVTPSCFICNTRVGALVNADKCGPLRSGRTRREIFSELVDETILESDLKNKFICKKCTRHCTDYDGLQLRLKEIKSLVLAQYNATKIVNNHRMTESIVLTGNPKPKTPQKTLVLPASKLKPLPPQYVLMNGKFEVPSQRVIIKKAKPNQIIKQDETKMITIEPLLPSTASSLKNEKCDLVEEIAAITEINNENDSKNNYNDNLAVTTTSPLLTTFLNTSTHSILNLNINSLPKNFLETVSVKQIERNENNDNSQNNDEQAMEIDEDCTRLNSKTLEKNYKFIDTPAVGVEFDKPKIKKDYEIAIIPEEDSSDYVVSKVEILDNVERSGDGDDDDEDEGRKITTILMQDENGSIIRVVAGQKYLYGDSEISLIIPEEGENGSDGNDGNQDSNDESQIELQVSGDEETANAIIAAAAEQGGAFIKVQSGAMYKVDAVESKVNNLESDPIELKKDDILKKEGSNYRCLLCEEDEQQVLLDASSVCSHFRTRHAVRLRTCGACGDVRLGLHRCAKKAKPKATVTSKKTATSTNASVSRKTKYECDVCHKVFPSRNLLSEHKNTHSGERPHSCHICGKTFASKYTRLAHMKTHQDRPRPFSCKQCKKTFFTQQHLAQHEITHYGLKEYVCAVCGKAFGTQHNLDVHGVVHSGEKPFLCGVCGKAFARKAEIRDHIRTHTGERPFACDQCPARFSQRSNLQSHRRDTHQRDKRHGCDTCGKRFKRRRLLEYHIKASHTGERPYKCQTCPATFVYPEHYKKHERIHSGEKPYVCEVCGKSFNSRDNRNAHRFVHSDKKPYECLVCGNGYMRKPLLYAHMNTSGYMTESIVVNQPWVSQDEGEQTIFEAVETGSAIQNKTITEEGEVYFTTEEQDIDIDKPSNSTKNENDDETNEQTQTAEGDSQPLISLTRLLVDGTNKTESSLLESLTAEDIEKGTQIVANDENGDLIRLVQIKLPTGDNGWIAID